MQKKFTISQLAKQVGLSPKTIRFYEEEGIVTSAERAENGYRVFNQSAVEDLKILSQARDLGLPLREMKKLMKGCDETNSCEHTQSYVQAEITTYVDLLTKKIQQLTNLRDRLQDLNKNISYDQVNCEKDTFCCNVLHQLTEYEKGGE